MNRPLICATVTASTTAELRAARDAVTDADLVELRLDHVADPDVSGALEGRRRPVIVTCRAAWEGGRFSGSEEERRRILSTALDQGAEHVDIEWKAGFDDLIDRVRGDRVVLSMHDFQGMPADLPGVAGAMRATGAAVIKVAGTAKRLGDCVSLLGINSHPASRGQAVLIAMGDAGLSTRVLTGRFGSPWTYAGSMSSAGQIDVRTLVNRYRYRTLGPFTRLFGLVGSPIGHSASPAMHNAAFAAAGIDAVYLPFPASDSDDFSRFAAALGVEGASVTIPFKVPLLERVDEIDDMARRIGAVNTIKFEAGRRRGRNTDGSGFLLPLDRQGFELRGARASVLGAGGSARSVAVALSARGAAVTIHARDHARARSVASLACGKTGAWPPGCDEWDLLVNCTPVGMYPQVADSPVPRSSLGRGTVYDLVYNPEKTRLLTEATEEGCPTIGGLDMLVGQAVEQFEWWTGVTPDAAVMRAAAVAQLAEFTQR